MTSPSDRTESDLSVEGSPPGGNQVPETPHHSLEKERIAEREPRQHTERDESCREAVVSEENNPNGTMSRESLESQRQSKKPEPPEPVVTRNEKLSDELWKMQEKQRVSDDAVDMGPIPGTEGIESDPPEPEGLCEAKQPCECCAHESPLPRRASEARAVNDDLHTDLLLANALIDELEAERDALRAERGNIRQRIAESVTKHMRADKPSCCDQCETRWEERHEIAQDIRRGIHG